MMDAPDGLKSIEEPAVSRTRPQGDMMKDVARVIVVLFVLIMASSLIVVIAPRTGAPEHDFLVRDNEVRDERGAVVHVGTDMSDALDWALSHPGTITYVPQGEYVLPDRVTKFADNVTLVGDGADRTIFEFRWDGTGRTDEEYADRWFFGFEPTDVSDIALQRFGVTGDGCICFDTTAGLTSNNLVEDVVIRDTSNIQMTTFGSWVGNDSTASGYRFVRCTAANVSGDGFDLWGRSSTPMVNGGMNRDTYFEDCRALGCGQPGRYWDWTVGWDLGENGRTDNISLVRCEASYSWESGFHLEEGELKELQNTNVTLRDCVANFNGQKYSDHRGPAYGYGCLQSGGTTFINFTADGNPGGMTGWQPLYEYEMSNFTYQVGSYGGAMSIVYGQDGTVAYNGANFTDALAWACSHENAIVQLPSGIEHGFGNVIPFLVTMPIYLANGTSVYGAIIQGNSPSVFTSLVFLDRSTGFIVGPSNEVVNIVLNGSLMLEGV